MRARRYQTQIILGVNRHLAQGLKRICIQLETGGGKTATAAFMANSLVRRSPPGRPAVLFIVHRRELLRQATQTLGSFVGEDRVGVIASGRPLSPWAPVQVASLNTLYRRLPAILEWLQPRMVVVDECHHIRATTWDRTIEAFRGRPLIGLTATPARLDGKGLHTHFDALVCGPSYREMVQMGALANVRVFSPRVLDQRVKIQAGDYSRSEQEKRLSDQVVVDFLKAYRTHAAGKKAIMFSVTRRASRSAMEVFRSHGIAAEHVDGDTDKATRDQAFRSFARGDIQILGNVELATEGLDVPDCQAVILARKTKSYPLYKQMIGRASRPQGGDAIVIDGVDNFGEHGHPMADVEWTLADGDATDQRERTASSGRRCAQCHYVYPPSKSSCPLCGHVPETRTAIMVDGDLDEQDVVKPPSRSGPRRNINQLVRLSGGDEDELRRLAARTRNPAGAIRAWKRIFGHAWARDRLKWTHRARFRGISNR